MMKRAFTLIELLIVVAIIAILAAIAVPNFLESQTRAKVSRVMADMRTIATAIEAYTVDYNTHPPDWWDVFLMTGLNDWPLGQILTPLTTPVAYLTSLPRDPFFRRYEGFPGFFWVYMTTTGYGSMHFDPDQNDPNDPAALFYGPRRNYRWVLDSVGPDMSWESGRAILLHGPWAGDVIYYDATNGTKSQGDIYYYGPGGGINPHPITCR